MTESQTSLRTTLRTAWRSDRLPFYAIGVATLLLIVFTFTRHRMTTNPRSRIITVERVIDAGTLAHLSPTDSTPYPLSIDRVEVNDKQYSSKPPLYPLIMIAQAWPVARVFGVGFYEHDRSFLRYLTLLNQVLPYGFCLLLALAMLQHLTSDRRTRRWMIVALSFGSLAYGYAVTINNHTPAALIWLAALYLVFRIGYLKDRSWRNFLVLGLITGVGVSIDLTSGAFAVGFMLVALTQDVQKAVGAGLVSLFPLVISLFTYWKISGEPIPIYLQGELYRYAGSAWNQAAGYEALREPKWLYFFHTTLGHHGLFSISPVLLLGVAGVFWREFWRKFQLHVPIVLFGCAFIILAFFVTFRTHNYGGYSVGMRWYIPATLVLTMAATPVIEGWLQVTWKRWLLAAMLLFSLLHNLEILYWEAFYQGWFERAWYAVFGWPF